jgi:arylsulfatase A-like enzyme
MIFHVSSTSAFVGCLVGFLDFLLFELSGNPAKILEYALYKPSLLSLSFLSMQLILFSAFGVAAFLALLSVSRIMFSTGWRIGSTRFPEFVAVTLILAVMVLRFYKRPSFSLPLATFALCASLIVVSLALARRTGSSAETPRVARSRVIHHAPFFLAIIMILASCAAPDAYSLLLRATQSTEYTRSSLPNVLLIVMDTVRADHLSCYGYDKTTSPNIDRIATEGLLFYNAYSTAPWTLPSHASMFTGLYPSRHGATWAHLHLQEGALTIAEQLRDIGYRTVGFSENPFITSGYGLAQGFSQFHETWRRPLVFRALQRLAARALRIKNRLEYSKRTTRLLQRWVADHHADGRPFFAFVNLMVAHHPRYPRRDHGSQKWRKEDLRAIEPVNLVPERFYLPEYNLNDRELSTMRDVYDSEIGYLDAQVTEVTRYLAESDQLDETILILTSDHGENVGDHGFIEHQFCLYNSLIRVPLIIRYPPRIPSKIVDKNVSLASLFNTILDLVNDPRVPAETGLPESLLADASDDAPVYAEFSNAVDMLENVIGDETSDFDFKPFDRDLKCLIWGGDKFIWSSNGQHEMYSLQNDRDETDDLFETNSSRARELNHLLERWSRTQQSAPVTDAGPDVDDGTRDALRALGYEQ